MYLDLHRKNPCDVETLISLGHICASVNRHSEAQSFYRRALEIEPWNNEARQSLAAVSSAPVQQQLSPGRSAEEMHAEASRHAAADRHHEAHSILEELVHSYNEFALGHNDLGVLRYRLGDIAGARQSYEQAVRLQPRNVNFRKNLADLYFAELGMMDEAIAAYLELFREQPRDVETLLALGQVSAAVGRPEEAKIFYRRALEIEPWNADARQALSSLTPRW